MVRIWEKITDKFPEWTLYMLGDGDARHILEKYCEKKHIPRIVFAGHQDSTKWYQRASLLCMTSSWEGWGLVLTEAMSYGCVPIAYNSFSSLQDIIQSNKNGVAVNAFAEKDYIAALGNLMADNDWRKELSDNACRSIKHYSIDNVGAKWENLLHSLI